LAWFEDPTVVMAVVLVVVVVAAVSVVVYVMRKYGIAKKPVLSQQKTAAKPSQIDLEYTTMPAPFKISKSVQATMAHNAKDELRILDLEREILGDAIRKLYEAAAEGKITETERERLAAMYKDRMNNIKESISKDENIIALHQLESMQEDLMKLFSERFGDITSKVEELRGKIDVKPIREIPIKLPQQTVQMEDEEEEEEEADLPQTEAGEKKPVAPKKRKPPEEKPDQKTEAERRIDSIRSEVEKVLDKLGQMEIES
jgi:hypothetical protein